ncbi:MAG: TolC family protein [Flavobacteriales bacterium]
MKKILFVLALGVCSSPTFSQEFTLKEAIDYALSNNANHQNVLLDQQLAEMKKNEIRGIGLPQLSASVDMKYYPQVPTSVFDLGNFPMGPSVIPKGTYSAGSFAIPYNNTAGIQISQILFSSDYIVALQASKSFIDLTQKAADRSKIETSVAVIKAYYTVLISKERAKLLDNQLERVKKLSDDAKVLFDNGLVESIDLDRITLAYNNLLSEKEKLKRFVELTETMLKFQMGYNLSSPIVLKDSIDVNQPIASELSAPEKFDYSSRVEYSLVQSQLQLNQLDLKRNKMKWMPSLVAYGNLGATNSSGAFHPYYFGHQTDVTKQWYSMSLVGVTLSIPIFDGTQTYYKTKQAQLEVQKSENSIKGLESAIDLEIRNASTMYNNALASLNTQKANIALAQKVYDASKFKYDQGMSSLLEVTTAENDLKDAQINYYNALFDFLIAKVDLEKATGIIK